jgi:hypothetical protein
MSMRNWNLGGIGLALAALAAVSVTACDPYIQANTSAPVVLGAVVADVNQNEYQPPGYAADGCFVPYAEPDQTWATATFPGLCVPANIDKGIPSVCPVACYPPRTGAGYAPFYMGSTAGSYVAEPLLPGGATRIIDYSLPADGKFTIRHAPPGAAPAPAGDFTFAMIMVTFNKLMDGKSIQPNPYDPARCVPATGANGPKVYKVQPASAVGIGVDVTDTELWSICYNPNSATDYWGASLTATPDLGELDPDTKYTVRAVVQDQQGNSVTVDVTVLTDPAAAAP